MNRGEGRPLRIGVNALYLIPGGVGGTEIYLRSLLPALAEIDRANRYFVFLNRETGADIVPSAENWRAAPVDVEGRNRPARIVYEQTELPFEARRLRLDVMFNPGFTAPLACACPNVTVFHDLQHKRQPENFRWFDLPFWRLLLYGAAHRSKRLIAVSEATRDDLIRFYRLDPGKIAVAPHGVDPVFFGIARRPSPHPFLLTVSTLHPHKNLDRLLRAFAEFHKLRPEFQLVIAGLRGFHAEALEALRAALGLGEMVRFTGWIPRQELYDLFAAANAFVYPTTFEGFGMPVLEALAAGIPTACSNIQPVSGIAGEAALQFDPCDEGAILGAMQRVVCDEALRERLAALGPVRAAKFSWEETARLTLEAICAAAGAWWGGRSGSGRAPAIAPQRPPTPPDMRVSASGG
jgi:glycosyltransferase involved in cell wall biosynthesis